MIFIRELKLIFKKSTRNSFKKMNSIDVSSILHTDGDRMSELKIRSVGNNQT